MVGKNITQKTNCCCSGNSGCCGSESSAQSEKRHMNIDFLYLDLTVCNWCQGTEASLDAAIAEVATVLNVTGIEVTVNKINVISEEQARQLQFISSPTIRINGRDIQLDVKESLCDSCGDLCGDDVDCRVWVYQGKEYTVPPKAMIIEAILREAYGEANMASQGASSDFEVPDNLKKFFAAMKHKEISKKVD